MLSSKKSEDIIVIYLFTRTFSMIYPLFMNILLTQICCLPMGYCFHGACNQNLFKYKPSFGCLQIADLMFVNFCIHLGFSSRRLGFVVQLISLP